MFRLQKPAAVSKRKTLIPKDSYFHFAKYGFFMFLPKDMFLPNNSWILDLPKYAKHAALLHQPRHPPLYAVVWLCEVRAGAWPACNDAVATKS